MSSENEDERAMEASEAINESQKKPKISYARDFLLSLSELDVCKKLPSGFDRSVLSEFQDASHGIQDRPRSHGSLPLQGLRRNDYSSSPPTRGDSSSHSRGVYGRWDNRSSGWSDKDGDSQSELDSDSGRRNFGNQSWRPWQNSEHDGLLGSGSFPRPSGFAAGTSAPKGQTNEHHHLNRSIEAYHPPRPFKAVPHTRTSTHDSFNDETFGSSECTSQDRAEEERKRRAAFESMRKEQQKVLQEKQKSNANKHTNDRYTDLVLEETKEESLAGVNDELSSAPPSVPNGDSGKSSFSLQSSKPRPLVPPGFRSTVLEKNPTAKPLISSANKENPKAGIEELHLLPKGNTNSVHKLEMTNPPPEVKNTSGLKMGEAITSSSSSSLVLTEKLGTGDRLLNRISGLSEVHEPVDGGEVFDLMKNNVLGSKIRGNPSQESTSAILGKLFGSAPTTKNGGSSGSFEQQESKPDGFVSPRNPQSSKFAQWFNEDEKKPEDDLSSRGPNDLFSLIVGGEKAGSQVPNITPTEHIPSEVSYTGLEFTKIPRDSKPVANVLTCEDLEQTILSEYSEKSSTLLPPVSDWTQENNDSKAVDNRATHHLLSLLQKGTLVEDVKPDPPEVPPEVRPEPGGLMVFEKAKEANPDGSGQNLTLETLFGTAFMKELQSAQAPVSVQRGGSGSNPGLDPLVDMDPFDGGSGSEIQLPEEESLITAGDPTNMHNPIPEFDISKKLAALNARYIRGPYDNQMHNRRLPPMFHPLDPSHQFPANMNSPARFSDHQYPANMLRPFHHPDTRVTGFDVPARPQMLPQMQMQMQPNFPPAHVLRDFPRPSPVHVHPHSSGFMADREAMHGFQFARGMPLLGPDAASGSNHPEALQRMVEMELRAAPSKQIRPLNSGQNQGTYGHELDMGFRYQ